MRLRALTFCVTFAAAGCASAGRIEGAADDTVQLTVVNESVGTVTAYAVWGSGRVRLGDVGQNRTRMFFTRVQGNPLVVGLEAIGAPPVGTTPGPTRFGSRGRSDVDPSAPFVRSEEIEVVVGDALELRYTAAGILTVRRLESGL